MKTTMSAETKMVRCKVCGKVFDAAEGKCPLCGVGLDQCEPVAEEAPKAASEAVTGKVRCLVCGEVFDAAEGKCPVCGVGLEQCEPVAEAAKPVVQNSTEKFLVLGGGAAAFNAAKAIREHNALASVVLLTGEEHVPYNRPMLTKALMTDTTAEDMAIEPAAWYDAQEINVVTGCTVTGLNPAEKMVMCEGGYGFVYDKLVYALGARCFLPPIPGSEQTHVVTIRTIQDAQRVRELTKQTREAVVIGGGVLGLEAAWALCQGGVHATVLEQGDQIMKRQIDAGAADILGQAMAKHGVTLLKNAQTERITEDSVILKDGRVIPAGLVIVSAGIRANVALAQEAGLEVGRNVVVDDHMRTSAPDVYACGDCAAFGMSYGLWSEATEMGRVAGTNAAGGDVTYQPVARPLIFHGMGTALFALGDCGKKDLPYQVEEVHSDGQYEKYWLVDGHLVGALLLGNISAMGKVMPAVLEGKPLNAIR
ncbi:MAG: FAD-dependent oxidoreductase [Aristaeellaceae bacterium]